MKEKESILDNFFDKSQKGTTVVLKSLKFIFQHKKLLFFPLLTGSLIACSIGIYDVVYYQLYHEHITSLFPKKETSNKPQPSDAQKHTQEYTVAYVLLIIFISLIGKFSFAFSNVALSYATSQAFTGAPVQLGRSMLHSLTRIPTLITWTLSTFFIQTLANFFKKKNDKGQSSIISRLIGEAIDVAWYVATFLAIPILAHENIGTFKSIRQSIRLMKKTFGEHLVASLLLRELIGMVLLSWVLISGGILFILLYISMFIKVNLLYYVGFPIVGILLIVALFLCAVVSAATTVFKTAAYYYAIGNPAGPFNIEEIKSSFIPQSYENK